MLRIARRLSPPIAPPAPRIALLLLRIECVVRESCCAGAEPGTLELQKLFLQDANSPNIILLQFYNFKT